jgi:multimeric flavodoxin WrbA
MEVITVKIAIITGTPKTEGLSASCYKAAALGVEKYNAEADAGATTEAIEIRLCDTGMGNCRVCGEGWGTCGANHTCQFGDDGYNAVVEKLREADAFIFQTPVYWGEISETFKAFLDRLRRCEASHDGLLYKKEVLLIAAPGGSGGGLLTALGQFERAVQHMRGHVFDFIGVNRWNRDYKLKAIEAAAYELCKATYAKQT